MLLYRIGGSIAAFNLQLNLINLTFVMLQHNNVNSVIFTLLWYNNTTVGFNYTGHKCSIIP